MLAAACLLCGFISLPVFGVFVKIWANSSDWPHRKLLKISYILSIMTICYNSPRKLLNKSEIADWQSDVLRHRHSFGKSLLLCRPSLWKSLTLWPRKATGRQVWIRDSLLPRGVFQVKFCVFAVPARFDVRRCVLVMRRHRPPSFWCLRKDLDKFERLTS